MPLKSTNIWDDVREETPEEHTDHHRHGRFARGASSSDPDNDEHAEQSSARSVHHANRRAPSMKTRMKMIRG